MTDPGTSATAPSPSAAGGTMRVGPVAAIPRVMQDAVLAIEDANEKNLRTCEEMGHKAG